MLFCVLVIRELLKFDLIVKLSSALLLCVVVVNYNLLWFLMLMCTCKNILLKVVSLSIDFILKASMMSSLWVAGLACLTASCLPSSWSALQTAFFLIGRTRVLFWIVFGDPDPDPTSLRILKWVLFCKVTGIRIQILPLLGFLNGSCFG
jgi:hypothetical protein